MAFFFDSELNTHTFSLFHSWKKFCCIRNNLNLLFSGKRGGLLVGELSEWCNTSSLQLTFLLFRCQNLQSVVKHKYRQLAVYIFVALTRYLLLCITLIFCHQYEIAAELIHPWGEWSQICKKLIIWHVLDLPHWLFMMLWVKFRVSVLIFNDLDFGVVQAANEDCGQQPSEQWNFFCKCTNLYGKCK